MEQILIALVKSIFIFFVLVLGAAYVTLMERKVLAWMQFRIGPNRVGPRGLLQPLGDAVKMMFKEDAIPAGVDRPVYWLAPALSVMSAIMIFAVIPVGPQVNFFGLPIDFHLADINVAVLYLLAVSSLGVYGIVLGGWSSNNKYSLLGSVRSSAQMISYELGMGLAILSLVVTVGSLKLTDIVGFQSVLPLVAIQPLAFLLYMICGVAENNRAPFDLPEAEQELVAGYFTEYGGMKFAMFYLAEYVNMINISAIATTLFLGGYHGPFGLFDGVWWFVVKVVAILFCYIWVRATWPRMRYDRLMRLGWQVVLPAGLLNLVVTAAVVALTA